MVLIKGAIQPEDRQIEDLWASMAQDGSLTLLAQLPGHVGPPGDWVGWMGDFHPPDMHFTYIAGALFEPTVTAPAGFLSREIEAGAMAVSRLQNTPDPAGGEISLMASLRFSVEQRQGPSFEHTFGCLRHRQKTLLIACPCVPAEMGGGNAEFKTVVARRRIQQVSRL